MLIYLAQYQENPHFYNKTKLYSRRRVYQYNEDDFLFRFLFALNFETVGYTQT